MTTARDIASIGLRMVVAGLPFDFVLRVVALARDSEGVGDMMEVWDSDVDVRDDAIAELQGAIDDREAPTPVASVATVADAERVLAQRRGFKATLRRLVDENGGVTRVAEASGIPQPSLSRILNSMSEPRAATLYRLAKALGLDASVLRSAEPDNAPEPATIAKSYVAGPGYDKLHVLKRSDRIPRPKAERARGKRASARTRGGRS